MSRRTPIAPMHALSADSGADPQRRRVLALLVAGTLAGAAQRVPTAGATAPAAEPANAPFRRLEPDLATRVLAVDPDRVTAADVATTLARAPAPRIVLLNGSVPLVTLRPLAEFLVAMGYPEERLRNADGSITCSSYVNPRELAGTLAWHCERDGTMPMLIGHSQGGSAAIGALHALAGGFGEPVPLHDPVAGRPLPRATITDALTGSELPVLGLRVPFTAALATGRLMRVLLGQWSMLPKLRAVPDTAEEFAGFFIPGDPLAPADPADLYRATGSARVRNVTLPEACTHLDLPHVAHLARDPEARAWIERFDPQAAPPPPDLGRGIDARNIVHAAYLWHGVKRHWCRAAQRLARAGSAAPRS